jgi:lipopolysaccharide export system permease protein
MIRRLDRYVLARFAAAFGVVTFVCVVIFVLFDFTLRAARFFQKGFTVPRMLQFYAYYVPELLVLLVPVVVTLALAWSIGRLARSNEITAMRATGVSPARIAAPLFIACAALACVLFVLNERVVTRTHEYIMEEHKLLYRTPPEEVLGSQFFYTDDKRGKLHFERYHVADKVMEDVSWGRPPTADSPRLHISAERAEWLGGQWWLFGARVTRIVPPTRPHEAAMEITTVHPKRIMYEWELPPDYITGEKVAGSMTLAELSRAIRRDHETQPERAREYRLERHERVVLPVITMLMLPVCFPFVVKPRTGGWRAWAALGVSLMICFGYYVLYTALVAVVRKWVDFPPLVWLPNLAYGSAGVAMFLRIR